MKHTTSKTAVNIRYSLMCCRRSYFGNCKTRAEKAQVKSVQPSARPPLINRDGQPHRVIQQERIKMKTTICPNCKEEFDANNARTSPSAVSDLLDKFTGKLGYEGEKMVERCASVECPRCHHQFPSEDVRFFGVLSPKALKIVLTIWIAAFVLIVFYILLTGK
jgi:hypothetical protein